MHGEQLEWCLANSENSACVAPVLLLLSLVHRSWIQTLDSRVTSHVGQWQERPQKFCRGLGSILYPATISLEQSHVVRKSPNFSAQPHSHSHSLSDFGQVPDSL